MEMIELYACTGCDAAAVPARALTEAHELTRN